MGAKSRAKQFTIGRRLAVQNPPRKTLGTGGFGQREDRPSYDSFSFFMARLMPSIAELGRPERLPLLQNLPRGLMIPGRRRAAGGHLVRRTSKPPRSLAAVSPRADAKLGAESPVEVGDIAEAAVKGDVDHPGGLSCQPGRSVSKASP